MQEKMKLWVLTGYLGAGKTTLLNHILSQAHGKKYIVIVNEFGDINIDHQLVVGVDEEIYEMNNGCVCCHVRGDLIKIIEGLLKRRQKFDGILMETTGLADPAPIAQTFFVEEEVKAHVSLDAIVTVLDAKWLLTRLKDAPEVKNQIAFADVLLLNKTDLVPKDQLGELERHIRAINPYVDVQHSVRCEIDLGQIFDKRAYDLARMLEIQPTFLTEGQGRHLPASPHTHMHDEDISSLSLNYEGNVDPTKILPWLEDIMQRMGPDILRSKGILAFADEPLKFVFHGVHMMMEGDVQHPWKAGERRRSQIVLIGRDLDKETLKRGFMSCTI